MKHNKLASLALCSIMIISCSKGGGGSSKAPTKISEPLETEMYGTYQALLAPINKTVSGHLNGSLTLVREKDEFIADVRFSGGPLSVLHAQNIHIGDRCPTEADDLNNDGYVDAEEAATVIKEILIPLDDDISSQRMGMGIFPVTDAYGYYFWSRATSFEKIMLDLREEDINLRDDYAKLSSEKSLKMLGKVVVIRGVPETTELPSTVQGRGRSNAHQALPVACGVIKRLSHTPGVIDRDTTGIPVPAGETIGGSSGADDGADFATTAGTTTGDTGNYGDDDADDVVVTTNNNNNNTGTSTSGGSDEGMAEEVPLTEEN